MPILSVGAAGQGVFQYDAADAPMSLVGEGSIGDALVIQAGDALRPQAPGGGGSIGDVSRNGATLDNRIARWHGTDKEIQNSGVSINDSDNITGVNDLTILGVHVAGSGPTTLTNPVGKVLLVAMEQDGASSDQALVWDGSKWAPGGLVPGGGAVGGSGTTGKIVKWTAASTLGDSILSESGSVMTLVGTLTVNNNLDGTTILGRAKIGSIGGDEACFAHYDHFTTLNKGFQQKANGATKVNSVTGKSVKIAINNTSHLTVDAFDVTIPTNDLSVPIGHTSLKTLEVAGTRPHANVKVYLAENITFDSARSLLFNAYFDSTFKYVENGSAIRLRVSDSGYHWFTAPVNAAGAGAALTLTQRMILDLSGNLTLEDGNFVVSTGDGSIKGKLTLGASATNRGILELWRGSGGNQAAYLRFSSRNGSTRYMWIEDDGTVKISIKVPVNNADGTEVGAQT